MSSSNLTPHSTEANGNKVLHIVPASLFQKRSFLERFRAGMALSQSYAEHNLYQQIVGSHAHTSRIS